ncbi:MAG: TraB/GumN family protein [Spirochaetaceae bacterium]|jgi:pheromone shutdown-related protein TraB|nr:TraB/GumN family protein [Spirochaetaceae bacterium]
MNETRMTINSGGKVITLIGTAHISKESINEVRAAIEEEKPDVVCVELDQGRYDSMNNNAWEKLNVAKIFKEGKGFLLMANLVLAGFQRRLGNELGIKPGEEMKAALETAKELGLAHSLCDREVQITLRRAWSKCGLWDKSKLIATLLASAFTTEKLSEEEIENLKKRNELDGMMNELASYLPKVKETLIDERDRYLAAKIWNSGGTRPLAVVGAGHMGGINAQLEKIAAGEATADVTTLDQIPSQGIVSRIVPWIIPALIIAMIAYGFYKLGAGASLSMILHLLFWNGGLAALGTVLALGHPLSVLVGFFGAPLATVNPAIGIGLFTGITEATMRKPRVQDAESINDDIGSIKGIYRNRILRALLVFFLSSVGAIVGNFIAIPSIAGQFFK